MGGQVRVKELEGRVADLEERADKQLKALQIASEVMLEFKEKLEELKEDVACLKRNNEKI